MSAAPRRICQLKPVAGLHLLCREQLQRRARRGTCSANTERQVGVDLTQGADADSSALTKHGAAAPDKAVKSFAGTFAPRASVNVKNPAVPGSILYNVFTWQAWACMVFGGLLSFNLLFPSDKPDVWRMWSIWLFTVPSLRARQCKDREKDWLNYSFLAIPLLNITLPIVWKSFAFVYSADCVALAAIYYWKIVLPEQAAEQEG